MFLLLYILYGAYIKLTCFVHLIANISSAIANVSKQGLICTHNRLSLISTITAQGGREHVLPENQFHSSVKQVGLLAFGLLAFHSI